MLYDPDQLTTPLNEQDQKKLKSLYREALKGFHHDSEARHTIRLLCDLFGRALFVGIDVENNPCPYRKKAGESTYTCTLALAEMKRLGKKGGYYTGCINTSGPCHDPLKTQRHQSK